MLKTLTAEHIVGVKVIDIVFCSADPTELVVAFAASDMVTSTDLFLNNHATFRTVGNTSWVNSFEIFLHSFIHLILAILVLMEVKATLHAYFIIATFALSMVWVRSGEEAVYFFVKLALEIIV